MVGLEEVRRIARLARLDLDDAELQHLAGELTGLLAHIAVLREVSDTAPDDATEDACTAEAPSVPEPDPMHIPAPYLAPDWRAGFFTAPRSFRPQAEP